MTLAGQGQTWVQVAELGLAFVLAALIGLEREAIEALTADKKVP